MRPERKSPHGLDFTNEVSLTKQSFKDECDINLIMNKYAKGQQITHINTSTAHYGDFSNVDDYQTSLNAVLKAQDAFYELPAHVRKEFNNDPAELIKFVHDDNNYEKAFSLGLISPETYQARQKESQPPKAISSIEDPK